MGKRTSVPHKELPSSVFMCVVCQKTFTQKASLKTHYSIHTGAKPYECDVCNRKFVDSSTLRKHSLIHSGKRPHVCEICKRSFVQKVTLRKHMVTHTGEKRYTCEKCGRAFAQKSSLTTHYRIHDSPRKTRKSRAPILPHLLQSKIVPNPEENEVDNPTYVGAGVTESMDETRSDNLTAENKVNSSNDAEENEDQRKSEQLEIVCTPELLSVNEIKEEKDCDDVINGFVDEFSIEPREPNIFETSCFGLLPIKEEPVETILPVKDESLETVSECFQIQPMNCASGDSNTSTTQLDQSSISCKICHASFEGSDLLIEHLYKHIRNINTHIYKKVHTLLSTL